MWGISLLAANQLASQEGAQWSECVSKGNVGCGLD